MDLGARDATAVRHALPESERRERRIDGQYAQVARYELPVHPVAEPETQGLRQPTRGQKAIEA